MEDEQAILHIKEEVQDDEGSFPSTELQNATHIFLHCEMCDIEFTTPTDFGTHVAEVHNKTTLSESYHTMGLMQNFEIDSDHDQLLCADEANPSEPNHSMVLERNPDINSSYNWLSCLGELSKSDILKVDLIETGHKMEPTISSEQQKRPIDSRSEFQNASTSGGLMKSSINSYKRKLQNAGKKPYSCSICGAEFSLLTFLLYHRRSHMSKKAWKEKGVGYAPTLPVKRPQKYTCSVCGRVVRDKTCLDRHMRTHTGEKPFPCTICGKRFRLKATMVSHMRIHTGMITRLPVAASLHCGTYGELLQDTNAHIRHEGIDVDQSVSQHVCERCGDKFRDKCDLERHRKSTNFKCYTCDKLFCNTKILTGHIRNHLLEKASKSDKPIGQDSVSKSGDCKQRVRKYVCSICSKGFRDLTDLKRHNTKHSNERPHACPHCKKCFKIRATLGTHMTKIHGEKLSANTCPVIPIPISLSCETCGKLFRYKSRLERHEKIHSKETYQNSCNRCGKKFREKYHLEQHKAKSITDKCPKCEKVFCNKNLYLCHIGKHHMGVIDDDGVPKEQDLISELEGCESDTQTCVCSTCGKGFRYLTDLIEHENNRTDDGPFPCPKCGKIFCIAVSMESHLKTHSKEFGIKPQPAATLSPTCHICGKAFMSMYSLRRHRKIHDDKLLYKHSCDQCGKKFRDKCDLHRHKKHRTGEHAIKCPKCDELFCNEKTLRWHVKTHYCDKNDDNDPSKKLDFVDEVKKKELKKKCFCSTCGRGFRDLTDLKRHEIIHVPSEQRPYPCRVCYSYFQSKSSKEAHMRSAHAPRIETAPEPCGICGQFFKSLTSLRIHLRLHNGRPKRAYSCEKCGKRFRDKCDFKRHMKSGVGKNPVKCPKCEEIFCNKKSLDPHLKNHYRIISSDNDKSYKCSECEKCFKELHLLNRHIMLHLGPGINRHACTKCAKTFRDKHDLTRHLVTHMGVTPYSCYECGKSFSTKYILARHLKSHTGEKRFKCTECEKKFRDKTDLTRHMRCHTGNKAFLSLETFQR